MMRYKVTAKVSVFIEGTEQKIESLKDAWRKNVREGKFQTGNISVKEITEENENGKR